MVLRIACKKLENRVCATNYGGENLRLCYGVRKVVHRKKPLDLESYEKSASFEFFFIF